MKLRWKYFFILLVVSLAPLIAITLISQKSSRKLGASISEQTRAVLMETARRDIIAATENYAIITLRSKSSFEFAILLLTRDAKIALEKPLIYPEKIYFPEDFDNPDTAPKDLASSDRHLKILPDGSRISQKISYGEPVYFLPQGIDQSEVQDDIARLSRLIPTLKGIAGKMDDGVFWIYATLKSGVHISYPGHGGYPADYDPRQRPWYLRGQNQLKLSWGSPIVDATTRQLTFTLSAPIFAEDGEFAGVAGIDILIPNVLLESEISSQWSNTMQSFMVGQLNPSDSGEDRYWILSEKSMTMNNAELAGDLRNVEVGFEGQEEFKHLIEHLNDNKSGSLEMDYRGVDSFWAYATIFPDLHFVIIAPKSLVTELPDKVGRQFANYTRVQGIITITAVCLLIGAIATLAWYISRSSSRNVMSMVSGFKRLEQGDFSVRLQPVFHDERDLVVTTFNQIMPRLEEHMRMSRALGVAKEVQQSLLPNADPTLHGFDIAGTTLYCEETGGDYYDFIPMDSNRLAVVVGDVSGHGVSSALLMTTARALVMLRSSMPGPASEIISDVNRHLSQDTSHTNNFMTFFYCELTARTPQITWVRAGHDPALVYDRDTDSFAELRGNGPAFGLDYTFSYEEFQRTLNPGQIILIGTDGIWEMCNEAGEMYGKATLKEVIRSCHKAATKDILAAITASLHEFRGSRAQEDDVTMVVVRVADGNGEFNAP